MTTRVNQNLSVPPPILTQQPQRHPLAVKLGEATVLRMKQIAEIARRALENEIITQGLSASLSNQEHPPIGIQYPSDFPSSDPDFERLKEDEHFMNGYAPQAFWVRRAPFQFQVKEDALPSDAIESIIRGPTVGDCGLAVRVAQYAGLMDVIGKEIFNQFFRNGSSNHIRLGRGLTENEDPIDQLTAFTPAADKQILGEEGNRPVRTGHSAFFLGHPQYPMKHPSQPWGGMNVICEETPHRGQIFLGLGLPPEGVSETKLKELLLNGYNEQAEGEALPYIPFKHKQRIPPDLERARRILANDRGTPESITGFRPDVTVGWRVKEIQEIMDRFQIETVRGSATATPPPSA